MARDETTKYAMSIYPHSDILVADIVERNKGRIVFQRVFLWEKELCRQYAARWLAGERWPDLYLNYDLYILDVHHRLCAAIMLGLVTVRAAICPRPSPSI